MAEQATRLLRDRSRKSFLHLLRSCVVGFCALIGLLSPGAVQAQHCFPGNTSYGVIEFDPQPGQIEKPDSCNLLPCYKPELNGAPYIQTAPGCDPLAAVCGVQIRVPLKFPGNLQMPNNTHSHIYWFDTSTPPPGNCLPPSLGGSCAPITVCGLPGNEILADYGEAYLQIGTSCAQIALGLTSGLRRFSLSAYSCQDFTGECLKKLDVPDLDLSPPTLWSKLCERPPECEGTCGACMVGGGAPGVGPGPGHKTGPGATLRYRAGGPGLPGRAGSTAWRVSLGRYWSHDYAQRLVLDPDASHVWLITSHATYRELTDADNDGFYERNAPSDEYRRLRKNASGWELADLDGMVDRFDAAGRWTETADVHGNRKVATYSGGALSRVDMPDGRREVFTYQPDGKLAAIDEVGVDGTTSRHWSYVWSEDDLVRIDRPDGTALAFAYGDARLPGYMTRMTLVGTDGSQRIEGAWEFDERGNRVRSWKGDVSATGPGAVEVTSYRFDNPYRPTTAEVTDPMGVVSTYTLERDPRSSKPRLKQLAGDCPTCGTGPNSRAFYEDPVHPLLKTRETDGEGTVTVYTYDANGQVASRTEAFGTPLQRLTTWEHNGPFPSLVTRIEQPSTAGTGSRRKLFTYDAEGDLQTETIEGVEAGSAFRYTTTYRFNAAGLPEEVDPPGFGTSDATATTYDPARGLLLPLTRTAPLVGTATYSYDPWNRRTEVTDPNGLRTVTSYDLLDRIDQVRQVGSTPEENLITRYEHNAFGDLVRTILPRGNVIEYGYDAAGRLVSIERKPDRTSPGERTLYALDGAGHRIRQELQHWEDSAWVTDSATAYVYSSSCHLEKVLHPDGSATESAYDCNGNLERTWDANHPSANRTNPATVTYEYDTLDRLAAVLQPWTGAGGGQMTTLYGYDVQDHLVQVTDPEGNVTRSFYSDRDLLTRRVSEVTGTTEYRYNEHGRLTAETDARGVTLTRTLDAADRLTFLDFPEDALDTRFTWDDPLAPFSKGRLTAIIRNGGTVGYRYDRFGRLIEDGALTYGYDANGNLREIGYPGGVTALYSFDFADREEQLVLAEPGRDPETLATGARYLANGPLTSLLLGNGLAESRTYTPRYFPASIELPGRLAWQYTTDSMGNVLSIQDALAPSAPRQFSYQDVAYFLTQANGPWGNLSWTYDRIGNRLSQTRDGATETYVYQRNAAGGNDPRLASVSGPAPSIPESYSYDAAGQQTFRAAGGEKIRFTYNAERHLAQISHDGPGEAPRQTRVSYEGRGFLLSSSYAPDASVNPSVRTQPTYSSEGRLYHAVTGYRPAASTQRDEPEQDRDAFVLYFAGKPLGLLEHRRLAGTGSSSRRLQFVETDHLGAPILVTDESGSLVWQDALTPFGEEFRGGQAADVLLRLPGQWDDAAWQEAADGLYYNVYRWYDARRGRYTQPDPLGLSASLNLFSYVDANPVRSSDPLGLLSVDDASCSKYCCFDKIKEAAKQYNQFFSPGWGTRHPKCRQRINEMGGKFSVPTKDKEATPVTPLSCMVAGHRDKVVKCGTGGDNCGGPPTPLAFNPEIVWLQPLSCKPICGSLLNTIFHEMLHLCGAPDESRKDGKLAAELAEECVGA